MLIYIYVLDFLLALLAFVKSEPVLIQSQGLPGLLSPDKIQEDPARQAFDYSKLGGGFDV